MRIRSAFASAVIVGAALVSGHVAASPEQRPKAASSASAGAVTIAQGKLQGTVENGIAVFRGVPYAAPPVGPRRWREPGAAPSWNGVRDATRNGGSCAEVEDCLFLNIFAPAGAAATAKHPVFVWIHGGGFAGGSGGATNGANFARDGVIVVSINYRLSRAGWFAHPALTAENPTGLLANYGNMDQIAALKWVRGNIAAFGGDPTNVTLGGSSAGAISTAHLMSAPQARGLFAKAISESNFGRLVTAPIRSTSGSSAEQAGLAFAESLGIKGVGREAAAALRALTLEQLRGAAPNADEAGRPRPIADGKMITGTVVQAFAQGKQAAIPYLFGDTDDDASLFRRGIDTKQRVADLRDAPRFLPIYDPQSTGDTERIVARLMADESNREPNRALARLHSAKAPTFVYHFTYVPAASRATAFGAGHSAETRYVFGAPSEQRPFDQEELRIADSVRGYWTAFMKTGNPGAAGGAPWPRFDVTEPRLVYTRTGGLEVRNRLDADRLDWIEARARQ